MIVRAAERNEVPVGRRDFAVGGGGDVQINEGQAAAQFRLQGGQWIHAINMASP